MMKKIKLKNTQRLMTICFTLSVSLYLGQDIPIIKTPQTYSIEKFGNIPVSLNTGNVSYDINLFNYGNLYKEEVYNIGLRYFGSGFVPSKKSNYVGLDWSLDIGGAISREVRGVPDDFFSEWTRTIGLYGFYEAMKNCGKPNSEIYNYNYPTLNAGNGGVGIKCGDRAFELEPDKFNFNFMGHSGYFFIGNNLNPIIVSEDKNLKIDISQLSSRQPLNANLSNGAKCLTRSTKIIITDGKGIKYYFGGDYENLEISYSLEQAQNIENKFTITAWNLYKIEYPNSNTLEIKYRSISPNFKDRQFCLDRSNLSDDTAEPFLLLFDQHTVYQQYILAANSHYDTASPTVIFDGTIYWGSSNSYTSGDETKTYATKKSIPEAILLNGKKVVNFDFERYERYRVGSLPSLRLKNITFYDDLGINILKEVNMSYYRKQDYFFLDHIKMFKKDTQSTDYLQHYTFNYYDKEILPDEVITPGLIDYWGYYNAFPRYKLVPNFNINKNTGDIVITDSKREANPALASMSLLKSITYPTGGRSEFIYEPHKYSEKIDRNSSSQFKNILIPSEGIVGGGRIQKIINYNNDGNQIGTKEFKYISNYIPNGSNTKSSGILSNYYLNISYLKTQTAYSSNEQLNAYSDNVIETTMNSAPILYSEVTEIDNNDGYTKSYFTDQRSHPDNPLFKEIDNNTSATDKYYSPPNIGNINLPYRSNNYKRGKLYKQEFYDQNFIKIKSLVTEFTDITEVVSDNYVTYVTDRLRSKYFIKQFGGHFIPKTIEQEDIFNDLILKTGTQFFYGHNHLNPTKKIITYPSGDSFETRYHYPEDLRHGNQPQQNLPPYFSLPYMISKNMVDTPLVISLYKNNIFQSRTQTVFEHNPNNNLELPKRSLKYYEDDMVPAPSNNGFGVIALPSAHERFNEVVYDQYDSKGNLLQYTTKDGIPTVIIWGYNETQPIAKIKGVKLENIQQSLIDSIIGASNTDEKAGINNDETALLNALKDFKQSLPGYQISTYTYDPLVGIRSITPPSGITEYYHYDSANRLDKVTDANGKILKEMKYNYKN